MIPTEAPRLAAVGSDAVTVDGDALHLGGILDQLGRGHPSGPAHQVP
jgi:hypothetical protein